jgi:hypothetical protein
MQSASVASILDSSTGRFAKICASSPSMPVRREQLFRSWQAQTRPHKACVLRATHSRELTLVLDIALTFACGCTVITVPISTMSTIPPEHQQSSIPPLATLPFADRQPPAIRLYPLSNYTFGVKETQPEEDPSVKDRLRRLEEHYEEHGMRRTCEGVLVCHEHNHPHVLMLQIANAFFKL